MTNVGYWYRYTGLQITRYCTQHNNFPSQIKRRSDFELTIRLRTHPNLLLMVEESERTVIHLDCNIPSVQRVPIDMEIDTLITVRNWVEVFLANLAQRAIIVCITYFAIVGYGDGWSCIYESSHYNNRLRSFMCFKGWGGGCGGGCGGGGIGGEGGVLLNQFAPLRYFPNFST